MATLGKSPWTPNQNYSQEKNGGKKVTVDSLRAYVRAHTATPSMPPPAPVKKQEVSVPFPTGIGAALGRQGLTGGLPMLGAPKADKSLEGAKKAVAAETERFLDAASSVPGGAQMDFTGDWTPQSYRQAREDLSIRQKVLDAAERRRDDIFLPMVNKSAGERIGLGARSIGETFAAAPGVMGETTIQAGKNFLENLNNEEYQKALQRSRQVSSLLYAYETMGRTESQEYQDLLDEQNSLKRELDRLRADDPVNMDLPGMRAYGRAAQVREGALAGMEGIPRWLGEQAISIGQNAALLPTAAINPAAPLVGMSAVSAADKMYELGSRGVGAGEALTRGLVSGGIEAATEKIPLESVMDILKTGGKGALKNILRQAGMEATEEGVSYVANYLADKAAKDPKATFSWAELGNAALAGGFSGGMMAGGSTLFNRVTTPPVGERPKVTMLPSAAGPVNQAAQQGQQKTASTGEAESTAVNTDPAGHTQEEMETITAYQNAVDEGIKNFVARVRTLRNKKYRNKVRYSISEVSDAAASVVKALTGVDPTGFENILTGGAVDHIDHRHGENGKADSSMADDNDLARVQFVLDHFDGATLLVDKEGQPLLSNVWKNSDNSPALQIMFYKKLDGAYYVVEAVPDSNAHVLAVESAYIGTKGQIERGTGTVLNMAQGSAPQVTPETPQRANTSPADSIPQPEQEINPEYTQGGGKDTPGGVENPAIVDGAIGPGYNRLINTEGVRAYGTQTGDGAGAQLDGAAGEGVRSDLPGHHSGDEVGRTLGQGDLQTAGHLGLSDRSRTTLTARGAPIVDAHETADRAAYSALLDEAIAADLENGWAVTPKTEAALEGHLMLLSPDMGVGSAIAQDGDIQAVFRNRSRHPQSGAMRSFLPQVIAAGGRKLDCYGKALARIYSSSGGFVPVARVTFSPEFANPGWTPDKDTPDIYVMMATDTDPDTIVQKQGSYHYWTDAELASLPLMEYDEAMAYRDGLLAQRGISTPQDGKTGAPAGENLQGDVDRTAVVGLPSTDDTFPDGGNSVGPDSSVGAATAGFTGAYGRLQGQASQFHPQGENARTDRLVDVPTQDFDGRNIPKSAATVLEAEATPESAVDIIQDAIAQGEFSFDTITDRSAGERARQTVKYKGWEAAKEQFHQDAKRGVVSKDNIALGQVLLNNAMNAGDSGAVIDLLRDYASMSTTAAQSLQAQRILKKLSPEGQLYGIERSIQSIQEELIEKYKDKAPEITLDEGLVKDFLDAKTDGERKAAEKAIYRSIADQIPATFADKWNAWRYLSMLGNPRTHVRNLVGNLGFTPVRMVKDAIATGLEFGADRLLPGGIQRTKAALNPASSSDRALIVQGFKDVANVEEQLLGAGKFSETPMGKVEQERTIFKTLPLETARKANSGAMNFGDTLFSKPAYAAALAGYLKANGVTAERMQNGTVDAKTLDAARAYAIREAQKATYRDTNALSEFISNLRYRGNNPVGKAANFLMEGVLPFRKTPANILMRGVEYSPIGLGKAINPFNIQIGPVQITGDLYKVRHGEMTAAQAIDNISAGLTGTGLLALGAFLASQGLVSGGSGEDEKQAGQDDLTGGQPYAISIGGKNYTLDWLAPEALPFFVGVELWNALPSQGSGRFGNDVISAVGSISEPMLEMSMLQSLQDLLDSVEYSDDKIFTILSTAVLNHLTQAVPTLLGQIERTAENRRDTTFIDRTSPIPNDMQYTMGRVANKLPGVEFQQIPYLDAWGREEGTGSLPERAVNNFLNPSYVSEERETDVDRELQRLYDAGYDSVFPQRVSQSDKVENEYLSPGDYVTYAKARGQTSFQLVSGLIANRAYQRANDEEKARMVDLAYKYANALAKTQVSDYQPSGWVKRAAEAEERGISPDRYIVYENTEKDGDGSGGVSIGEYAKAINQMFSDPKDRETMFLLQYPKWPAAAEEAGVSISEYIQYKTITESAGAGKKQEKIQALVRSGMSEWEAEQLYDKIK